MVDAILAGGWAVFWIYWFISAIGVKRTARYQNREIWAARVTVWLVALALFRLHVLGSGSSGDLLSTQSNEYWLAVGLGLFLIGLGGAVWARLNIGKNWGMPTTLKENPELVTTGPYRFIRHPIYSGILLALLGTALATSFSWLLVLGLCGVYFVYSAFVEERNLTRQFPQAYPIYRQRTKMLIPLVL